MTTRRLDSPGARGPAALLGAGVVVALASVVGLLQLAGDSALLTWTYTHWAFTYDHGVVKRALVGEVLQQVVPPAALLGAVSTIALVLAAITGAALCAVFWRPWFRHRSTAMLAFAVVATTHVATLQHVFYDLGRFDQIGLLLTLLCVAVVLRWRASTAATVTVVAACAVGLFVHEAFLFISTPLIVACWVWQTGRGQPWLAPRYAALLAMHAAVLILLVALGPPDLDQRTLVQELSARHGTWISPRSVQVLYGDITAEAARSLALLASGRRIVQHAVLALALAPTGWLILSVVREARRQAPATGALAAECMLLVSALSPLLLYAIGIDFARWWALALTNLLVALGLLLATSPRWTEAADAAMRRHPAAVWAVLAVNLVAGPLGVAASPFPRLEPTITAGIGWLAHTAGSLVR